MEVIMREVARSSIGKSHPLSCYFSDGSFATVLDRVLDATVSYVHRHVLASTTAVIISSLTLSKRR